MRAERKESESELLADVFFTNIVRGKDGDTPEIKENGNWWLGDRDTGVLARGVDGKTPTIGNNGNWWVGGVDTGVVVKGKDGEDGYLKIIVSDTKPTEFTEGTIWIKQNRI